MVGLVFRPHPCSQKLHALVGREEELSTPQKAQLCHRLVSHQGLARLGPGPGKLKNQKKTAPSDFCLSPDLSSTNREQDS